jgi:hypothetical protein
METEEEPFGNVSIVEKRKLGNNSYRTACTAPVGFGV